MAGLKIAFLIIGAFLLATQVESKPVNDILIVKILKEIIKVVDNVVNQVLAGAETIVAIIDGNYVELENKLVDITRNVVTQNLDRFNKVLNEISKHGSADEQKLIACFTSEESDVADIPANFVKSISSCVEDDTSTLLSDLMPLIKDLYRTANKTSTIVGDLVYCDGNGVFDLLCVAQVLDDITAAIVKDIPVIVSDLVPIRHDSQDLHETVVKCLKSSVLDMLAQLEKVGSSINSCYES
ncbi:unnamed protein product [Psylliodes chrysocephalus]|uniref:Uncharacterized protein n=1 Tax=Psylliodes chrysocephalus TaxID=3402493 RepID=A0A9P0CPG4_9CUCU|nr:unnamed protein product [Psylliodes chrysocephala]